MCSYEKHLTRNWLCCIRRNRVRFISVTWDEYERKRNSGEVRRKIRCLIAGFFQTFKRTICCIFFVVKFAFQFIRSIVSLSFNDLRYAKLGTFHRNIWYSHQLWTAIRNRTCCYEREARKI